MNKFDKFLEFLFQSRKGRTILVCAVLTFTMLFGGCFITDYLACFCGTIGCNDCSECWQDCDYECYRACDSCHGCTLFDYFFNPEGCTKECDCAIVTCGGFNSSCLTQCGTSCDGGCGEEAQIQCGNCSCDRLTATIRKNSLNIRFAVVFPEGTHDIVYSNDAVNVNKKSPASSFTIRYNDEFVKYFDFSSYCYYKNIELNGYKKGTLVAKGETPESDNELVKQSGRLVDDGFLAEVKGHDITLIALAQERRVGEMIAIRGTTEGADIPIPAYIGGTQMLYQEPSRPYMTFIGWRLAGTDNEPVRFSENDTFHLYTLMCDPDATEITLEPVFSVN